MYEVIGHFKNYINPHDLSRCTFFFFTNMLLKCVGKNYISLFNHCRSKDTVKQLYIEKAIVCWKNSYQDTLQWTTTEQENNVTMCLNDTLVSDCRH